MMGNRTLVAGGVLAAAMAAVMGGLWAAPPPSATLVAIPAATAEVTRGRLVDTKTVTGTLGYGTLSHLRPSLGADAAMVTWIAPVGAIVARGQPLYRLEGRPAVLFYGIAPQHRTLRFVAGASAPVWVEHEDARAALHAAELALDLERARRATAETRLADIGARLADALSATPATPEFVELADRIRTAEARVDRVRTLSEAALTPSVEVGAAEAELATARARFDDAVRTLRSALADVRLDAASARLAVANAEAARNERRAAVDALAARADDDSDLAQIAENLAALGYGGPILDQVRAWQADAGLPVTGIVGPGQIVVAPGPVHIAAHGASIGEVLSAASPDRDALLDYSDTAKRVTVPLAVGDQGLAAVGREATITLPDDRQVAGIISEVGSVVTEGAIAITITIADQAALGGLEVAAVDVALVSRDRADVLSVPVTALLAAPDGGFALEVVDGDRTVLVPVDAGLFAGGRVEVSGEGIAEGVRVVVPA